MSLSTKLFLINAQPRGCKRLADNKPGPFRTWTDNFAQNEGLCGDTGTVLKWQLRLIKWFVRLSIAAVLALLRYAWPFLCLGSNGRWNFIWLFQPFFGDLIYGLAAASVPSCGSLSHVRDGFSLQAFLNLPEICLSQIILSSVFHCGVFFCCCVGFFFSSQLL